MYKVCTYVRQKRRMYSLCVLAAGIIFSLSIVSGRCPHCSGEHNTHTHTHVQVKRTCKHMQLCMYVCIYVHMGITTPPVLTVRKQSTTVNTRKLLRVGYTHSVMCICSRAHGN